MIDVHVHLAAFPDGKNGCYISPKMLKSPLFRTLYHRIGIDPSRPSEGNQRYLERLIGLLKESQYVQQAAILAMDGAYNSRGELDSGATEFLIANDYILETARRYPDLFKAGVSINPQRKDALEELDRCLQAGAYLLKVLPNAQGFDPANPAYKPFWKKMAAARLPLLCHVGYEFSLVGKDQSMGDPTRLRAALDEGVEVIAAHGMSFGFFFYEKFWGTFLEFVKHYPNFRWDASALSLPNRAGMLLRLRNHPELHDRMVFGTDYPLTSFAFPALLAGQFAGYLELRRISNPFDRHYRLLQILGFHLAQGARL